MIKIQELKAKAERLFPVVLRAFFVGEDIFPIIIPSNKKLSGTNFSDWVGDIIPLNKYSKASVGKGYSIDWKIRKVNGSTQSVPEKIYFETLEDYLVFSGNTKKYHKIIEARDWVLAAFPQLVDWLNESPTILLDQYDNWKELILVCQYFIAHPPPHEYYLRELPIQVHSKFIEQNVKIIRRLLDRLLPADWIDCNETSMEGRYQLKRVNVHTQVRILDDDLKPFLGYDECSLTLEDISSLRWLPEKVFIIENKVCYLTFPKVKNAVAIFGEGFRSRVSEHISWLDKPQMYCWFDLDCAGFEILNMIRKYYPNARSFLMDIEAFNNFERYAVENKVRIKQLDNINEVERTMYEFLHANHKRLEQERISQEYVNKMLFWGECK